MLKYILFSLLSFNLFALEVSLTGAKENFVSYSTLHVKDTNPFLCQEMTNDFEQVTQIVCAFNKKPTTSIKELQNSFFKIENKIKKKTFFLIITPFKKIKLYPMIFDMTKDKAVYQADVKLAKHWMIVGYKEKIPYIKKDTMTDIGINFPFELEKNNLPFVGSLDIKGNPVHIKRVGDVTDYLRIKKLYKKKKYDLCLELIDDVMEDYPNSLFASELIYYKIRVYARLNDYDNVIELSKNYLREYSSDENVPEVLALAANAYSLIGLNIDADYFFDRLFSEHADSIYAQWGYIYKGQMLEVSGGTSKALGFYKKALNETADIEIATTAAYRLAFYYVNFAKKKEGAKYIMKIVKAKPSFFMQELKPSMDMMYILADDGDYITAGAIAKSIIDQTNKEHDEYERLLKDRGIWLSKSENKKEALLALDAYMKEFKYGLFEEEIAVAKDELFFDTDDGNFTAKLNKYNNLIEDYRDDSIGNRAIYEKSKLLLDNKMYSDVLSIKDSILELEEEIYPEINIIINDAAIGVMKLALENRQCQSVLDISNDYNITLSNKWDNGVYECSMMGGDYLLSKEIASRNLKSKDLKERKKWLYRYIKVDFSTGNYSEVIKASQELIALIEEEPKSKYKDIYRILFDTYQRLEDKDKLLEAIINIQKVFGISYKDIERYVAVMSMGNDKKDDNIVIKYGEEVMKIQSSSKSFAQSPFVEFTLYQAYLNRENLAKALKIIRSLDTVELSKLDRSRQKYLLGSILSKLWRDEDAQKAYQEAIDIDKTSPWADLAKGAMKI